MKFRLERNGFSCSKIIESVERLGAFQPFTNMSKTRGVTAAPAVESKVIEGMKSAHICGIEEENEKTLRKHQRITKGDLQIRVPKGRIGDAKMEPTMY